MDRAPEPGSHISIEGTRRYSKQWGQTRLKSFQSSLTPLIVERGRYGFFFLMSTLLPITPPRIPPATAPITPPFTLLRLVVAPMIAPAAAPMAASRWVCLTVVSPLEVV